MCDFSKKLMAWMDGELPDGESAGLERHVSACGECSNLLVTYKGASEAFDVYCEAAFAGETRRRSSRWLPAAVAAGMAAAAVIVAFSILPHQRIAQLPRDASSPAEAPHVAAPPAQTTTMALKPADAMHPNASANNRSPRKYVAAAVPHGRIIARGTGSRELVQSSQARNLGPFLPEPHVEIAIPADAMFPPGAAPPGMSFAADLTISADGSAERLGLRPRLAEFETKFERRRNQP